MSERASGVGGLPRVFTKQCSTCVGRPGNLMRLGPGRLHDIVERNLATGSALICHKTTYGQRPDIGEVICHWWWQSYGARTNSIVVMRRLARALGMGGDGFDHIEPPTDNTADTDADTSADNIRSV